jgi:hypothetical protein
MNIVTYDKFSYLFEHNARSTSSFFLLSPQKKTFCLGNFRGHLSETTLSCRPQFLRPEGVGVTHGGIPMTTRHTVHVRRKHRQTYTSSNKKPYTTTKTEKTIIPVSYTSAHQLS